MVDVIQHLDGERWIHCLFLKIDGATRCVLDQKCTGPDAGPDEPQVAFPAICVTQLLCNILCCIVIGVFDAYVSC